MIKAEQLKKFLKDENIIILDKYRLAEIEFGNNVQIDIDWLLEKLEEIENEKI